MKMKSKILIVFSDPHLAYSPTTLNLKEYLGRFFSAKVLAFSNTVYFHKIDDKDIIYISDSDTLLKRIIIKMIRFFRFSNIPDHHISRRIKVCRHLIFNRYDKIIAVDSWSLWYVHGFANLSLDYLSLELNNHPNSIVKTITNADINNFLIQNEDRLKLHFIKKYKRAFFVQNAPPFYQDIQHHTQNKVFTNNLVYSGTAISAFGFFSCLKYLESKEDFTLTVLGAIPKDVLELIIVMYPELLHKKRLIISSNYLEEHDYCLALSGFSIGFCFYEFYHPQIVSNYENYYYAPSGKMFKYLAAGVPVIGIDIPGLKIIKDFNAGILLKEVTKESISRAINDIERNYKFYVNNCFLAAAEYDFHKSIKPYVLQLQKEM